MKNTPKWYYLLTLKHHMRNQKSMMGFGNSIRLQIFLYLICRMKIIQKQYAYKFTTLGEEWYW